VQVLKHREGSGVSIRVLWRAVIEGFEAIWPEHLSGIRRGDVWCYSPLKVIGVTASDMVPFHKLSQWLTFSLLEPIESLGVHFTQLELMTGLAEYRNGSAHIHRRVLLSGWHMDRSGVHLAPGMLLTHVSSAVLLSVTLWLAAVCSWTWAC
jgi:hypothetical protein